MPPPIEIYIDDVVQTRKAHPCGGDTWRVVRLGAEIGMRCLTCDRKVFLPRAEFERRVKRFVERGNAPESENDPSTPPQQ
ncbi:MAG: DUF951 family protein [Chloroflexaceae bacterium]|nr:DUF951 family protein [Chloroflexaceae bacterium]